MKNMTVRSNYQKRTFTIRIRGNKYRTLPMTRPEFEDAQYRTEKDWEYFLRTSQAYYVI